MITPSSRGWGFNAWTFFFDPQQITHIQDANVEDTIFILSVTWKDKTEQESKVEKLETENLELKKVI
jgi:hypothetical protein